MNELQMFDKLERALDRELEDKHLSPEERKKIVDMFVNFYGESNLPKEYPISGSLDEKFVYILYDFYGV